MYRNADKIKTIFGLTWKFNPTADFFSSLKLTLMDIVSPPDYKKFLASSILLSFTLRTSMFLPWDSKQPSDLRLLLMHKSQTWSTYRKILGHFINSLLKHQVQWPHWVSYSKSEDLAQGIADVQQNQLSNQWFWELSKSKLKYQLVMEF